MPATDGRPSVRERRRTKTGFPAKNRKKQGTAGTPRLSRRHGRNAGVPVSAGAACMTGQGIVVVGELYVLSLCKAASEEHDPNH